MAHITCDRSRDKLERNRKANCTARRTFRGFERTGIDNVNKFKREGETNKLDHTVVTALTMGKSNNSNTTLYRAVAIILTGSAKIVIGVELS